MRAILYKYPVLTATLCGFLLVGSIIILLRHHGSGRASLPRDAFHCENGHQWNAPVTAQPQCPECNEAGISDSRYLCGSCSEVFTGMEVKKLAPGEFRYRARGSDSWTTYPPVKLTCSHCATTASLDSGTFTGQGYQVPEDRRGLVSVD